MFYLIAFAIGVFAISFLLGSIPWGLIISKVFYKKDIRDVGSGNIGTTNAFRAMGKVGGTVVFLLDFGKGLFAGLVALGLTMLAVNAVWLSDSQMALSLDYKVIQDAFLGTSMLGSVWGHVFSPWLGFKGGKGIATAIGCLFVVFGVIPSVIELAVFAVVVLASRYVSLGSILSALLCPFLAAYLFWGEWYCMAALTVGALTIVWAHRGNIKRLMDGNENRVGGKKKTA